MLLCGMRNSFKSVGCFILRDLAVWIHANCPFFGARLSFWVAFVRLILIVVCWKRKVWFLGRQLVYRIYVSMYLCVSFPLRSNSIYN